MMNFLSGIILSLVLISSTETISTLSIDSDYSINDISYEEKEVEWHREGLIGRHRVVGIDTCTYKGIQAIQTVSEYYDSDTLTDFTFTDTFETVRTSSISVTQKYSSEIMNGLKIQAGFDGVEISDEVKVTHLYTLERTYTYTISEAKTYTVSYKVNQSKVEGKVFALCYAADVYEIQWHTRQIDDYWWGDYEVSGSRQDYKAFITVKPYLTVEDREGNLL